MSFDVNVLSSKPVIREAQNMQNDGGGGNLGYMSQGRRQKKEFSDDKSIFLSKDNEDIFGFEKDLKMPEEEFSLAKLIAKVIYSIKTLFTK